LLKKKITPEKYENVMDGKGSPQDLDEVLNAAESFADQNALLLDQQVKENPVKYTPRKRTRSEMNEDESTTLNIFEFQKEKPVLVDELYSDEDILQPIKGVTKKEINIQTCSAQPKQYNAPIVVYEEDYDTEPLPDEFNSQPDYEIKPQPDVKEIPQPDFKKMAQPIIKDEYEIEAKQTGFDPSYFIDNEDSNVSTSTIELYMENLELEIHAKKDELYWREMKKKIKTLEDELSDLKARLNKQDVN